MKVFKFGGASIHDSEGFRRLSEIVKKEVEENQQGLCLVVSALGKTTNTLEKLSHSFYYKQADLNLYFDRVKTMHYGLAKELFPTGHSIFSELDNGFLEIEWVIEEEPHTGYNFIYDQIVSIGEILSSKMVWAFLQMQGISSEWVDSRGYIQTDNQYRSAKVNWTLSKSLIENQLKNPIKTKTLVCPGFIGGTSENYSTTLGREGSDYSAAIFASSLGAESLTLWKDVPGIMNADPKINPKALFIPELSFHELSELSFYGANVIHPKTIKPLWENKIPLIVKSFLDPEKPGTLIGEKSTKSPYPIYILKRKQMLLSLYSLDGSFIMEENLSHIYSVFTKKGIHINLSVNSALSFSVLIDQERYQEQVPELLSSLNDFWKVRFNQDLNLLTVRYNDPENLDLEPFIGGEEILIEISTRHTLQKVSRKRPTI